MTADDPGQLLTLTQAAAKSGYSREALRQRVRRGRLSAIKDNSGVLRIADRDLADLPPPDESTDDQVQESDTATEAALDILTATLADLRSNMNKTMDDLERTRLSLDASQAERLAAHGRAERAEAQVAAERARAEAAEARLAAADAALADARTPWVVKVARALRR